MKRIAIVTGVLFVFASCSRATDSKPPAPPTTSVGSKLPAATTGEVPTDAHIGVSGLVTLVHDPSSMTIGMVKVESEQKTAHGETIPRHTAYLAVADSAAMTPKPGFGVEHYGKFYLYQITGELEIQAGSGSTNWDEKKPEKKCWSDPNNMISVPHLKQTLSHECKNPPDNAATIKVIGGVTGRAYVKSEVLRDYRFNGDPPVARDTRVARLVDLAYKSDTIEIRQNGAVVLTVTRSGSNELYVVFVNATSDDLHKALSGAASIEVPDHHFKAYYNGCDLVPDKRPIPWPSSDKCPADDPPLWTQGTPFPPPRASRKTMSIKAWDVYLIGSVDCGPDQWP